MTDVLYFNFRREHTTHSYGILLANLILIWLVKKSHIENAMLKKNQIQWQSHKVKRDEHYGLLSIG